MSAYINRDQQILDDQNLASGLTKHAATMPSLTLAGTSHPTTDLVAMVLGRIATANSVKSTEVAWHTAVKADADGRAATDPLMSETRRVLGVMFAGHIDALADFGLKAPKPPTPLSPEQKVAAVAKAKATREARHIMGSRQRAAIKAPAPQPAPQLAPAQTAAPAPAPAQPAPTALAVVPAAVTPPRS